MTSPGVPVLALCIDGDVPSHRALRLAQLAEAIGFARVWFSEDQFARSMVPTIAAIAVGTETIGLGAGVFTPYSRHPTLIAAEATALDELAAGRFTLGVGSGATLSSRLGATAARPIDALTDTISILRLALSGVAVDYRGEAFTARDIPASGVSRTHISIYIAAMGPRAIALAGRLGDGLLISDMCPPAYTRWATKRVTEGATSALRPATFRIVQSVPFAVSFDGEAAHEAAKRTIGRKLCAFMTDLSGGHRQVIAAFRDFSVLEPDHIDDVVRRIRAGEDPMKVVNQTLVNEYSVSGTPAECIEQLCKFRAAGATEVALAPIGRDPAADLYLLADAL